MSLITEVFPTRFAMLSFLERLLLECEDVEISQLAIVYSPEGLWQVSYPYKKLIVEEA